MPYVYLAITCTTHDRRNQSSVSLRNNLIVNFTNSLSYINSRNKRIIYPFVRLSSSKRCSNSTRINVSIIIPSNLLFLPPHFPERNKHQLFSTAPVETIITAVDTWIDDLRKMMHQWCWQSRAENTTILVQLASVTSLIATLLSRTDLPGIATNHTELVIRCVIHELMPVFLNTIIYGNVEQSISYVHQIDTQFSSSIRVPFQWSI